MKKLLILLIPILLTGCVTTNQDIVIEIEECHDLGYGIIYHDWDRDIDCDWYNPIEKEEEIVANHGLTNDGLGGWLCDKTCQCYREETGLHGILSEKMRWSAIFLQMKRRQ